jgi:nicotinamidase-related amidase
MNSQSNLKQLCDVDDSCLIIIDIQEKLSAAIPAKVINRLRKNTNILLNATNLLNIPVITTAQYPKGLGPIEEFITSKLTESSKNFEKTNFSCLGANGLAGHLKQFNKKQVILIGIEAHVCVSQSAIELNAEGYDVFVVTDAIASREFTSYESALLRLNQAGINLLNTESALFEWLRDASHPQFKSLSKLIL